MVAAYIRNEAVRDDIHKRAPINRCLKDYLRTCLRPKEFENFGCSKAIRAAERLLMQLRPEFCGKLLTLHESRQLGHPLLGGDILSRACPRSGLEVKIAEICSTNNSGESLSLTNEIARACEESLRSESLNCESYLWEAAPQRCRRAMRRWNEGLSSVPWNSLIQQRIAGNTFREQGFVQLA